MIGLELVIAAMLSSVLAAAFSLALLLLERFGPRPRTRAEVLLGRVSFGLVGVGALCFLYAELLEADWLQVTHVTVRSKKLAPGEHLTIAHLSDLHVDRQTRALMELEKQVRLANVDLLVFTGDAINTRAGAELFRRTMSSLPTRLGRIAVRGNHDVYRWSDVDLFGGGVATELLHDAPLVLEHGTLALCGAPFGDTDEVEACLARAPKEALTVFAYHTPDLIEGLHTRPDLYLAGHTHGGQVRLPFYGAVITFSRFGKKYEMGRYEVNGTTLYVNRGIGFEPVMPRVRFLARPELTLIHVVPE